MMVHKEFMLSLGNKIKKSRDLAGLTQEQLAEAIRVTRSSVAQYESGEKEPTVHHLADMAIALGVSTDYLLGIDEERTNTCVYMSPEARKALENFINEIKKNEEK